MSIQATSSPSLALQTQSATALLQPAQDATAHLSDPQDKRAAPPPDKATVQEAVNKTAEFVQALNSNLQFSVDDATGVTVVKVVDRTTNELIRQIPNEEMLEIARALDRISGLLVKSKA